MSAFMLACLLLVWSRNLFFVPDVPVVVLFGEGLTAVNGSVAEPEALCQHLSCLCLFYLQGRTNILLHIT